MLERAAGCLESGSLRRLLPGSKKPMKTQRMLHSTFWIHGAGDLDLPQLWTMLAGEYDTTRDKEDIKSSSANASSSSFLLDFLYPAGTATFLRQFSWRSSNQSARLGHRLFSSGSTRRKSGDTPGDGEKSDGTKTQDTLQQSSEMAPPDTLQDGSKHATWDGEKLDEMTSQGILQEGHESTTQDLPAADEGPPELQPQTLQFKMQMQMELAEQKGDRQDQCELVWRRYRELPSDQQYFVAPDVLKYLSSRALFIDPARLTTLLDAIPPNERDEAAWISSITTYIAARILTQAAECYRMFLEYHSITSSNVWEVEQLTTRLLSAQISSRQWELACATHIAYCGARPIGEHKPGVWNHDPVIFQVSASLPELPTLTLSLHLKIENFLAANAETEDLTRMKDFAACLASHALTPPVGKVQPSKFGRLLDIAETWSGDNQDRYVEVLSYLEVRGHHKIILDVYRRLRQRYAGQVSYKILREVLRLCCDVFDVEGIQDVLNDFFSCHGGPDKKTYELCLRTFSRRGDVKTVEALFEQYAEKFLRNSDGQLQFSKVGYFTPLMSAYAARGELKKVMSLFNEMQSNLRLKPNRACWNILINAYCKVRDIDGAFQCFDQMLKSDCQPNHWTIGTLMGVCVNRGDTEKAVEIFELGKIMRIPPSTAMIDCLVLAQIQEENLEEAQKMCEEATKMELELNPNEKYPRTRMWNQLLTAHALRRDLVATNAVLGRMQELSIDFDKFTYGCLLKSLAMTRQPIRAWQLLTRVMPKAGVAITNYHYAIVMGGFLAIKDINKVFKIYQLMLERNVRPNASTSLALLKGNKMLDERRVLSQDESTRKPDLQLAQEYFDQSLRDADPMDMLVDNHGMTLDRNPMDVAYQSSVYSYMIFVHGSFGMIERVNQLYKEYLEALPEDATTREVPIRMLGAVMEANLKGENYAVVEQCWDLALKFAQQFFTPFGHESTILHAYRFGISRVLSPYISAMARQNKFQQLQQAVAHAQQMGFEIDCEILNKYIRWLLRGMQIRTAFELCETKLMDRWMGWQLHRWLAPVRNALPVDVRRMRLSKGHLRPYYYTLLCLGRAYLDATVATAANPSIKALMEDLRKTCPKLLGALETMPMTRTGSERQVMARDEW